MKRTAVTLITLLVIFQHNLLAREISTNPSTGMTLSEVSGIYTISGKNGIIVLGSHDDACRFLTDACGAVLTEVVGHTFNFGGESFKVGKDKDGMFVSRSGAGYVTLRTSDVMIFSTALGLKTTGRFIKKGIRKAAKIWNSITG